MDNNKALCFIRSKRRIHYDVLMANYRRVWPILRGVISCSMLARWVKITRGGCTAPAVARERLAHPGGQILWHGVITPPHTYTDGGQCSCCPRNSHRAGSFNQPMAVEARTVTRNLAQCGLPGGDYTPSTSRANTIRIRKTVYKGCTYGV